MPSIALWKYTEKSKFLYVQMSTLGHCIRACCNVKAIHFFWHLPSKMLQISIVISFSEPVWDYRLHLRDVWCVCFYGIKRLTFKLVQLLILEGREWCFLPALIQLSPLLSAGKKKSKGSYMKWKRGTWARSCCSLCVFCGTQSWHLLLWIVPLSHSLAFCLA